MGVALESIYWNSMVAEAALVASGDLATRLSNSYFLQINNMSIDIWLFLVATVRCTVADEDSRILLRAFCSTTVIRVVVS